MPMTNKLACLSSAGTQTHAVNNIIQTLFQHGKHLLASNTLLIHGFLIKVPELAFENAVIPTRFLLFAQLQTIADDLRLFVFSVLTRSKVALLDSALFRVTTLTF